MDAYIVQGWWSNYEDRHSWPVAVYIGPNAKAKADSHVKVLSKRKEKLIDLFKEAKAKVDKHSKSWDRLNQQIVDQIFPYDGKFSAHCIENLSGWEVERAPLIEIMHDLPKVVGPKDDVVIEVNGKTYYGSSYADAFDKAKNDMESGQE
jgi:hypothetical protein